MMQRTRTNAAFTLVELVIVVVIIGIIAAIAVPRISRGARGADEAALRADLAALRGAIDLYAAEHGGDFPGAKLAGGVGFGAAKSVEAFESQLAKYTDVNGLASNDKTGKSIYGPYIRRVMPPLPVGVNRGSTTTSVGATGPAVSVASGDGWVYNYISGEIIANADDMDDSEKMPYNEW